MSPAQPDEGFADRDASRISGRSATISRQPRAGQVDIRQLQQSIGNRGVSRLLGGASSTPRLQRMVLPLWRDSKHRDELMEQATKQSTGLGHGVVIDIERGGTLKALGDTETLWIVAHGSTASLAGMEPKDLARFLTDRGLPPAFRGAINLAACDSGRQPENVNETPYAQRFAIALAELRKRSDVEVVGYKGGVILDEFSPLYRAAMTIRVAMPEAPPDFKAHFKNLVEIEQQNLKQVLENYLPRNPDTEQGEAKQISDLLPRRLLYEWHRSYQAVGGPLTVTWGRGAYTSPSQGPAPPTLQVPATYEEVATGLGWERLPPPIKLDLGAPRRAPEPNCVIL